MALTIKAEKTTCGELKEGDLFSTAGPDYWNNRNPGAVGEKVYICTGVAGPNDIEAKEEIYRITIER